MSKNIGSAAILGSTVPVVQLPESLVAVEFTEDKYPYFAGEIGDKKYVVDCRSVRPRPRVGEVWCVLADHSFNEVIVFCKPVSPAVLY